MDNYFDMSKEEAPDNIPMMFITVPSSKDPEADIRHPGTNPQSFLLLSYMEEFMTNNKVLIYKNAHYHSKKTVALCDWHSQGNPA